MSNRDCLFDRFLFFFLSIGLVSYCAQHGYDHRLILQGSQTGNLTNISGFHIERNKTNVFLIRKTFTSHPAGDVKKIAFSCDQCFRDFN